MDRLRLIKASVLLAMIAAAGTLPADEISRFTLDGDFLDTGPGGNHGAFVGNATPVFVPGRDAANDPLDLAISFDGVDDYVRMAQTSGLPIYNQPAFTVTLWVKGAKQADRRVFSEANEAAGQGNPLLNIGTDNTADLAVNTGAADIFIRGNAGGTPPVNHRKSTRPAFDNTWHHIAYVDNNGQAAVYVDGLLDTTNFNYTRPALTANTTTLGAIKRAAAGSFYTGAIDDVRLFSHALTAAEVQAVIASPSCPPEGDTTCSSLLVDGPADSGPGTYTLTSAGTDTSGDTGLLYTFVADNGAGTRLVKGPQPADSAAFPLTTGTWTLTATVDDTLYCFDSRPEDTCTQMVVVFAPPMLVSHWKLDGDVLDAEAAANHGTFFGDVAPTFTDGFDGTAGSAIQLDGVDDYVALAQTSGLPIAIGKGYTVALWVRGAPQQDRRVFAEGSSADANPLLGIGTHPTATPTGQAAIYIRNDGGAVPVGHRLSGRDAFDGTWHHLAWVDDNGQAALFIDGVRDSGEFRYTRGLLTLNRTAIGAVLRAAAGSFFAGAVDDVRVYNYALSPEEVSALVPELPTCVADADTHCVGLVVNVPGRGGPGTYTASCTASDDSGDPVLYTFTLRDSGGQFLRQVGPQTAPTAAFDLDKGSYNVSVAVDDAIRCKDAAADASCSRDFVVGDPAPIIVSHWTFDGTLLDAESGNDGTFVGKPTLPFKPGFDCASPGALQFDGAADYVEVTQTLDLPISRKGIFSVALWVKGGPQVDRRVFSESSKTNRNTLFNIGTDSTGATGTVDIFIRNDAGTVLVPHIRSAGIAFDNTWHHILYTDEYGAAKVYIDGVLDATNFNYTPGTLTRDTTTIGGILRNDTCCWFNGRIDDVRLYSYALDEDEVTELFGTGRGDCCPEEGDTHCKGLTITPPAGGGPGSYRADATAIDDSGDAISYEFTASNGVDPPLSVGPQAEPSATFDLTGAPGSSRDWSFTVRVDDDPVCADAAADASCSAQATVRVCPGAGDTHCQGITVTGPAAGGPGAYTVKGEGLDDSGDPVLYTFTASNGVDAPMTIGPQAADSAAFTIGGAPGSTTEWTFVVVADDDAACPDAAGDASCTARATVSICPDAGDTHCQGLVLTGPAGGGPGEYTAQATATDDSGDAIDYRFTASNGVDAPIVIGPQLDSSASFDLGVGSWTIGVLVDDGAACGDSAADASCEEAVEVAPPGVGPMRRGDANADASFDLTDAVAVLGWLFQGASEPPCLAAANPSLEEDVTITSAVYLINFLFLGGGAPRDPYVQCGRSAHPVDLRLGCKSFPPCQ